MPYLVSRNGQTYGPYTLDDLQRYVASGHVQPTDLAQAQGDEPAGAAEWKTVSQLLAELGVAATAAAPYAPVAGAGGGAPAYGAAAYPVGAGAYPPPPNLSWGLMLLFSVLTCGLFSVIYELIQATWLKRVVPGSKVQLYYILAAVFWFLNVSSSVGNSVSTIATHSRSGAVAGLTGIFGLVYLVLVLLARFTMRSELEQHYNTVEPVGLTLSGIMTFFFGGFYFQYHFNRINELKRAMLYGAGVPPR